MKRTRFLSLLLFILLLFSYGSEVSAENNSLQGDSSFSGNNAVAPLSAGSLSAESAIIIHGESGLILFQKNAGERLSMASTTKIMTALLSIESGRLTDEIKMTPEMVKVEGTSMGLKAGDSVSLYELCCGMLLPSGNDAANAAAIYLGKSISGFAAQMNKKAKQIGMKGTNFVTPSGLDDEKHYTTAADMAVLAAYAMKNPTFAAIAGSQSIKTTYGNPPFERTLTNHNRFLQMYDGACGIKTGFTKKSGRCLVTSVRRGGCTLVAVTLHAPDDWDDHIKMYDYGFSQMKTVSLSCDLSKTALTVSGGTKSALSLSSPAVSALIPDGHEHEIKWHVEAYPIVNAPIQKNTTTGCVTYYLNGGEIASSPLLSAEAIEKYVPPAKSFFEKILDNFSDIFSI